MGKKTKVPKAPDYSELARRQSQEGMLANRPNQNNQYGSLTWSQDPTTGQWTQTNHLNSQQQGIFDQQQQNQSRLAQMQRDIVGNFDTSQIDFSKVAGMPEIGQYNQQATDLYNQLAQPGLDRQGDSMRARLAAQGMSEFGSRAGTNANQQIADMISRSGMMGAQAGIQQGNIMFNQGMQLHNTGIQDILSQRGANMEQLSGLMGLGQNVGLPQYNGFMSGEAPDYMGAAQNQYNANMNTTNARNADRNRTGKMIGDFVTGGLSGFLGGRRR